MKSLAMVALLIAFPAAPLLAIDYTVWGSRVDMQGSNSFEDGFETTFESGEGLGLTANLFLSDRFSAELGVFGLTSDATMSFQEIELNLGSVDLVPVTAGVQFHPAGQSRVDPYIGGGAAYVTAEDLESDDLTGVGLGTIELDDQLTFYANAGIAFQFTPNFGLALDARYIPYEPSSQSTGTGGKEDFQLTPLLVSAGLRFRF